MLWDHMDAWKKFFKRIFSLLIADIFRLCVNWLHTKLFNSLYLLRGTEKNPPVILRSKQECMGTALFVCSLNCSLAPCSQTCCWVWPLCDIFPFSKKINVPNCSVWELKSVTKCVCRRKHTLFKKPLHVLFGWGWGLLAVLTSASEH